LRVIENSKARDHMGKRGQEIVREQFTWSSVAKQMELAYQKILGINEHTNYV